MEPVNISKQLEILQKQKIGQTESQILIQLLKLTLKTNKNQFDALTEKMNEGFAHCKVIYDKSGKPYDYQFLSVNKAFEKQSGISAAKTKGRTILELFPNAEKSWIDFYLKVVDTQQPDSATKYSYNTKKYYASSACSTSKGEFIMLFKDVTESIELALANEEIEKRKKLNTEFLDNMTEAFSHCKIICNEKGKPINFIYLYVNQASEKQIGFKAEYAIGKTILEIFPDIEKSWIETLGQVALTGKPDTFVMFNHNTNKYFQTNLYSPTKGEFAMFNRDVTKEELKRIELELAYKKADESEKLKSAFLANMSHEIRTPMNAILGFSSLLEDDAVSEADKKTCLKQIKSSGEKLLTIISDIVDISKIDAKQQKLALKKCNLNQLFDELYSRYFILNISSEISIKLKKGKKQGAFNIVTDEMRLNQILSNLIDNALKHTKKGEITFGYTLKDNHIEYFVKDTGIGIDKENQEMIFERFAQIKNPKSKVATGTGLGIPIAKGLVELLGGKICMKSEPQKGSTFFFCIPHEVYEPLELNSKFKHTILIAKDDDVNFLLINIWLNTHFNVIRAVNGLEVLNLLEKPNSIDLILMDIRMPEMDGIEATKAIRKMDIHIPIIAHTAYAMNEESINIQKAGCNQVLIKPTTKDKLLQVLAKNKVTIS